MTFAEIKKRAFAGQKAIENSSNPRILVGAATCGQAAGANALIKAISATLEGQNLQASITRVGCIGLCYAEPIVNVVKPGYPHVYYGNVTAEIAPQLILDYLVDNNPRADLALGTVGNGAIKGIPKFFDSPMAMICTPWQI
ncbi:ferredoxin, partial [Chloroflexota bacterium]